MISGISSVGAARPKRCFEKSDFRQPDLTYGSALSHIGWEIDNIAFQGITDTPFAEFIADLAKCRGVPKKDK